MNGVDVVVGLTFALLVAVILIGVLLLKVRGLAAALVDRERAEKAMRAASVRQSRSVHVGSISQQLAPLLPGFRYNPKDVQWIGGTVDAVVWNGLENGDVEIVFLDVKTGRSRLTDRQRRIRDAIAWKRVAFDEYRPPETKPLLEVASSELPGVIDLTDEDVSEVASEPAD